MVDAAKAGPNRKRVPFLVEATAARDVRVTGDFNHWVREGIPLSHDGAGTWRTVLTLEPGDHEYRLLVDGAWADHAGAAGHVPNPFGTENCVLKVP